MKAAQLATFLITLKEKLERLLLEDFYKAVEVYAGLMVNADRLSVFNSASGKQSNVPEQIKECL